MSHTVVYDQHENTKQIMNAVNSFARHCKIGKVTRKPTLYTQQGVIWPKPWFECERVPLGTVGVMLL